MIKTSRAFQKKGLRLFSGRASHPEWIVLSAYTLATLILTTPLIFHVQDRLSGSSPDSFQNIWNLWWVLRATIAYPTNPFYTHAIYYPDGVSLLFHTLNLTNGLLAIPLQLAFGVVVAGNLIILVSFVLTAYAEYLLALFVVKHHPSAFVAGFILTFSPFHFAHLWGGQMQLISLQWLPLFLFFSLRTLRHGRLRDMLIAAFLLCWIALTDWYYLLFAVIAAGLLLAAHLFQRSDQSARRKWILALASMCIAVALLMPLLVLMLREAASKGYMYPPASEVVKFSADVTAFFSPSALHPLIGRLFSRLTKGYSGGLAESSVYLGLVPLALMLLGTVRRRLISFPWLLIWLVSVILALGPVLHFFGRVEFGPNHLSIPAPYSLVAGLPLLTYARSVSRFVSLTMISLGILAGLGLRELLQTRFGREPLKKLPQYGLGALILGLIYFEFLAIPVPMQSARIPKFAEVLASDPTVTGILDLPDGSYVFDAYHMFYQTLHQKPLIGGYVSRLNPHPLIQNLPVSQSWGLSETHQPEILTKPPGVGDLQFLKAVGISHLVIHRRQWRDYFSQPSPVRDALGSFLPVYQDEEEIVYSLKEVPLPHLAMALSLDGDWYPPESVGSTPETLRWIKDEASIVIWAPNAQQLKLDFSTWSFDSPRHVELYVNGQELQRVAVPSDTIDQVTTQPFQVQPGLTWVQFHPIERAVAPRDIGSSDDSRLLAVAIAQVSLHTEP
jgi:hypothetical protein